MSGYATGDKVRDFELLESMESTWKLSEHLGGKNIVMLLFPLAFSPPCTEELCSMRDGFHEFRDLDAEVIAASIDSPFVLAKWKEELGLQFPLLSDFNTKVCQEFGACHAELGPLHGVAKRSAFVIDNEGKLRYSWISDDPGVLPKLEEIKKVLEGLD
ncbi:MAG: redoxin domain-containing protein [Candidatus Krumholzibacteriota bacterium]|nr:redoxin domain-containing protein [Candidatus Krumholzibacteriota bacterium]